MLESGYSVLVLEQYVYVCHMKVCWIMYIERTAPRFTGLYVIGRDFMRDWAWNRNMFAVELAYLLAAFPLFNLSWQRQLTYIGRSQNGVLSLRVLLVLACLEFSRNGIINPRRACATVTVLVLSVCLYFCVFSLFWHLAQSGVQTAASATSARYGHEI